MNELSLRKVRPSDKKYFTKWWRDKELLKLTSGVLKPISDKELDNYFLDILKNRKDFHFIITLNKKSIGHISLSERKNSWYETQIIIGEKKYWNKGYGSEATKLLIRKSKELNISKIYLEVRPDNLRAINAYKKSGFIEKGIKKYPKNKYLPEVLKMELIN
ncbi:MAG: GNAT family N-acetyltransferase [Parcubacteria group bacterium]|nr:GNAT family N-acetyltransferase [Parcubacteria group bacterium]